MIVSLVAMKNVTIKNRFFTRITALYFFAHKNAL